VKYVCVSETRLHASDENRDLFPQGKTLLAPFFHHTILPTCFFLSYLYSSHRLSKSSWGIAAGNIDTFLSSGVRTSTVCLQRYDQKRGREMNLPQ